MIDCYTPIRAERGNVRTAKGWIQEAAKRMLMNNLDPEVAEKPEELIVYGGRGKAARNWECFHTIIATLDRLENNQTLLVQSGKAVAVLETQRLAPRVLIANSNLVPKWATWEEFDRLDAAGLMMYGQMTAGSWIYIGTQGILQGTYETFRGAAKRYCVLVTGATISPEAEQRLDAMVRMQNGFELAEFDLQQRGPGEFFGTRQAGLPEFRVANLARDREILELAKVEAEKFVDTKDPAVSQEEREAVWSRLKQQWQRRYGLVEA